MKNTVFVVLTAAAAALLSLIGLTGVVAEQRANRINEEIVSINAEFHQTERLLEGLRGDLSTTQLLVRDYMADPVDRSAGVTRARFAELEASVQSRLEALSKLVGTEEEAALRELRAGLSEYFEFLIGIPAAGRKGFPGGTGALRRQLHARGEAVVTMTQRVAEIDERRYALGNAQIEEARHGLSRYLRRMTIAGLLLGVVITLLGGQRILTLQRRARVHHLNMERSEAELRRLSTDLVRAQEEERRAISRELHDEVGQTLTALGIEIGNIERLRHESGREFGEHVAEARRLTQQTLRTVRDLAMGLRPSLLDDSGLVPALRWQVKEFSKRTGVPVTLQLDGALDNPGDSVTTCIYRVVQEALTNCARHAGARNVRIALHGKTDMVSLAIQDDGIGFDPNLDTSGIGIVGIEERVRDLGGKLTITSERQRGTLLLAQIPLPQAV